MDSAAKIIICDDDTELRNMLSRFLTGHGFKVQGAKNRKELYRYLQREPHDLLILDLVLSEEDGLLICSQLRTEGYTLPILMLTGKDDPDDRAIGLEIGADDYLGKPFVSRELVARVHALLRRQQIASAPVMTQQVLSFGDFHFDVAKQQLTKAGEPVEVHSAQMLLLIALANTPNRPVSRDYLIERSRGREHNALGRSVDVQVLRLRQIIEDNPSEPRYIKTVWGAGYMLIADTQE